EVQVVVGIDPRAFHQPVAPRQHLEVTHDTRGLAPPNPIDARLPSGRSAAMRSLRSLMGRSLLTIGGLDRTRSPGCWLAEASRPRNLMVIERMCGVHVGGASCCPTGRRTNPPLDLPA